MNERRSVSRVLTKVVANCIRCKAGSSFPEHFVSFTKDISMDGARLIMPKSIEAGSMISVAFELPTSFIPVLIHAEVIWSQSVVVWSDALHSFTDVGVKFVDMQGMDEDKLKEFMDSKTDQAVPSANS